MMYNKFNTRKTNDKKLLHKVGKQWKVVSVSLLMAIAGAGAFGATHANADTTNANTNTQNTINSLEAQPQLAMPTANSAKPNSASNSVQSNSSSVAPSAISYVSGDNGSAASYHNKAMSDSNAVNSYNTPVQSYVSSLNNEFPQQTKSLNDNLGKTTKKLTNDKDNATKFGNITKQSNYNSELAQSATAAGNDVSDYVTLTGDSAQFESNSVANDKAVAHVASLASSYANVINDINSNPATKASYEGKFEQASANLDIATTYSNATKNVLATAKENNNTSVSASNSFDQDKLNYSLAGIKHDMDNLEINKLAKSLGYSQAGTNLYDELNRYATVKSYSAGATSYSFTNVVNVKSGSTSVPSNSSLAFSANSKAASNKSDADYSNASEFSEISGVIADLHTRSAFSSVEVSYENTITNTSSALSSAVNAAAVASDNYTAAKSAFSEASVLNQNSLNNSAIFGQLLNSSEFSSGVYDEVSDALSGANSLASYSTEDSIANSNLSSDISASNSVDSTYAVPLASYYASSYANDAKSDAKDVANASSALTSFYNQYTSNQYGKANDLLTKATNDEDLDSKLATAYGMHVYNYSPKYINVIKGCELRNSTDYTAGTGIQGIHRGTALQVFGVGFSENGTLRYKVQLNGNWGYVTANPKYTKPTYLFANQPADVIASANIGEYNSAAFSADSRVKTVPAGTELTGTVVPMPDGNYSNQLVYGGFTRIKLDNGDYVTANTDWVAPAQHQSNNTTPAKQQANNNNNNNQQGPVIAFN